MLKNRTLFISYRRDDSSGWAGRLEADLRSRLGTDVQVFMDVDAILAGEDFARAIDDAVSRSDALVALIGPGWVTAQDTRGRRRLDDPNDLVRIEIESALQRGTRVIPVLVGGASLPSPEVLPETLRDLTKRQAVRLDHETWSLGLSRLVRAIERRTVFAGVKDLGALAAASGAITSILIASPLNYFNRRLLLVVTAVSVAYLLAWSYGILLRWLGDKKKTLAVIAAALVLTMVAISFGHSTAQSPRSAEIVEISAPFDPKKRPLIDIYVRSRGLKDIWIARQGPGKGRCYISAHNSGTETDTKDGWTTWIVNRVLLSNIRDGKYQKDEFQLMAGTVNDEMKRRVKEAKEERGAGFDNCGRDGFTRLTQLRVDPNVVK